MKLDALLSMNIIPVIVKNATGSPRPFIQFYLDNDVRGPGADSIQTFFGLDFNLGRRWAREMLNGNALPTTVAVITGRERADERRFQSR